MLADILLTTLKFQFNHKGLNKITSLYASWFHHRMYSGHPLHSPVSRLSERNYICMQGKGPGNSFSMRLRDADSLEACRDKESNESLPVWCSYRLYHYPFIHTHVSNRKERASHRIQEVVVGRELCSGFKCASFEVSWSSDSLGNI